MKEIIKFLRDLQKNNNTEWFHAHRKEYEAARDQFGQFAMKLIAGVAQFDKSTEGLELKDCTYRINRDIRFSADKSPYKTHFGVFISPGGKKSGHAGYYFHLSVGGTGYPDESMVAIGHYCYDKKVVEIVREDLQDDGKRFDKYIQTAAKDGLRLDYTDALKKVPKDLTDFPYKDYWRLKTYCLDKPLDDSFVCDEHLLEHLLDIFKRNQPFVAYLNQVIDYTKEED